MTSATTQPARGASGHCAEGQGYGLVLFASIGTRTTGEEPGHCLRRLGSPPRVCC
jgi:hypothetical protein